MIVLTPAERRAGLLLVALLALGAVSDLLGGRGAARDAHPPAPGDTTASAAREVAPVAPISGAAAATLDLNRATAHELDDLPGVGPVLAARILEHRRQFGSFRAIEDLRAVRGIGPRLFERLKSRVRVGPAPSDPRSAGPAPPPLPAGDAGAGTRDGPAREP